MPETCMDCELGCCEEISSCPLAGCTSSAYKEYDKHRHLDCPLSLVPSDKVTLIEDILCGT